jgi:hypothetical protein
MVIVCVIASPDRRAAERLDVLIGYWLLAIGYWLLAIGYARTLLDSVF